MEAVGNIPGPLPATPEAVATEPWMPPKLPSRSTMLCWHISKVTVHWSIMYGRRFCRNENILSRFHWTKRLVPGCTCIIWHPIKVREHDALSSPLYPLSPLSPLLTVPVYICYIYYIYYFDYFDYIYYLILLWLHLLLLLHLLRLLQRLWNVTFFFFFYFPFLFVPHCSIEELARKNELQREWKRSSPSAWASVLYQVVKCYVLNRVTPQHYAALPGVDHSRPTPGISEGEAPAVVAAGKGDLYCYSWKTWVLLTFSKPKLFLNNYYN